MISATPSLPQQPQKTHKPGWRGGCTLSVRCSTGAEASCQLPGNPWASPRAGTLHLPRLEDLRRLQGKKQSPQIGPHPEVEA